MRHLPLVAAVATLLILPAALAKVAFMPVEERVKNSDVIVIAKVTAVADTKVGEEAYKKLDVTVTETLKGSPAKEISVLVHVNPRRNTIPAVGASNLYYLKSEEKPADGAADKTKKETYTLGANITMFSIVEPGEADAAKAEIKKQAEATSRP